MNKLTKFIFCILFAIGFGHYSFGQIRMRVPVRRGYPLNRMPANRMPAAQPRNRVEQVKESFIGKQLKLTSDESRAFWPVYRQYEQEITAVRILKRMNLSDKSIDGREQITKDLEYESQILEIRKNYYNDQFLRILPPEKVSELSKSERAFNDELLKQLNERSVRAGD